MNRLPKEMFKIHQVLTELEGCVACFKRFNRPFVRTSTLKTIQNEEYGGRCFPSSVHVMTTCTFFFAERLGHFSCYWECTLGTWRHPALATVTTKLKVLQLANYRGVWLHGAVVGVYGSIFTGKRERFIAHGEFIVNSSPRAAM